jgi:O-antigen ligase
MDLVTVLLFLVLYYIRPQEWTGAFATIHFVQIVMLTAIVTLFTRERGIRAGDLFRTPHDWMMLGFWLWLVVSAPSPYQTFRDNANLLIFYIVIVQTLYTVPRMTTFIRWWTILIVVVAALALLSLMGFDPLNSREFTDGPMRGRLTLNLSIFNNPNALGHSVVPCIPMIYYYFIYKRGVSMRVLGIALMIIPFACIYLTQSKGAFLSAGVTTVATAMFGRPKTVQAIIAVVALMFGTTALYSLPRMTELNKSKGDEAIQGRVAAFKHGYRILTTTKRGVGKGEWHRSFFEANHYEKASHSSYVTIGGELGYPGLFFFCGCFYCGLRTLMTARTQNPDEERLRRMLFVLVIAFMVSSWMVNFDYRATYFMFTAAIAALHRHLSGMLSEQGNTKDASLPEPAWRAILVPQPALAGGGESATAVSTVMLLNPLPANESKAAPAPVSRIGRAWNKIGWFDLAATWLLMYLVVRFWAYIMMRM